MNTVDFLSTMYGRVDQGWLQLTYIMPEEIESRPVTSQCAPLPMDWGGVDPELPTIMHFNQEGYGVYFCVGVRGRKITGSKRGKENDTIIIPALWVDVDDDSPEALERLRSTPPGFELFFEPSILVHSGGGYHAYWLLHEPLYVTDDNRAEIKRTLKGMALAFNTDVKVAELARVMRLPGTVNTKPKRGGVYCEIIDDWDGKPPCYHYSEFENFFASLVTTEAARVRRYVSPQASQGVPKWVQEYMQSGREEGERNKTLFRASCTLFDNGYSSNDVERMLAPRALADGLAEHAVMATIRSAYSQPRRTPNIPIHMRHFMASEDSVLE